MAADTASLADELGAILGAGGVITEPGERRPFETDWRGIVSNPAEFVALPRTVEEVAAVVKACAGHGVAVVPQGGNTSMVAGAVPVRGRRQIVLSLARLNRIREVDPVNNTMVAEAGVILETAQHAASAVDRLLPLSLAAEGSCDIGGNIATNAGGVQVLAYGSMRNLVLGLEVVLPDGRIWDGLRTIRKDNTGLDLKQLFIGSEGTLGIITAAAIRIVPRPRQVLTALAAVPSPEAALKLFVRFQERNGGELTSFEYFGAFGLSLALHHVPSMRLPFDAEHPAYALIELSALDAARDLAAGTEDILMGCLEAGIAADATIAQSEAQRKEFWTLRENLSEGERAAGGSLKHDVSVPITRIPEAIAAIEAAVEGLEPAARLNIFGHFGDGNLHVNVLPPQGVELKTFLASGGAITAAVETAAVEAGGSFSAEHGIGQTRIAALARHRGAVELDLMRTVKQALDPLGLLNPGKIFAIPPAENG